MSNIFQLTEAWKQIVDMADELDDQTLEDTLEAIEGETSDKIGNMIAVVKNIKGELDMAKEYKKQLEARIATMGNTISRLNEYIHLGVETVGKPKKGAEQFKKLEIKQPWAKSAWTQYNPPKVEIVDERLLDDKYLVPQPPKVDTKEIAKDWKENVQRFEEERAKYMSEIQQMIDDGKINESEADARLMALTRELAKQYEIKGVDVTQSVGVRYR